TKTEADNARKAEADARKAEADAREQKGNADRAAEVAKAQTQETLRALAESKFMLADAGWREGHVAQTRDKLDEGPGRFRGWEWHYLKRQSEGGIFSLKGHTEEVTSVAYSPDGQRLATGSRDRTVKIWDARTGQELLALRGHKDGVLSVCFSPDGLRLA